MHGLHIVDVNVALSRGQDVLQEVDSHIIIGRDVDLTFYGQEIKALL